MMFSTLSLSSLHYPKVGIPPAIEELTRDVGPVQQRVLTEILNRNANTEYLNRFGLSGSESDREAFKSKVPVVGYEDVQPYIQRIADGDRSPILSGHPISELLASSGTSGGESKLLPTIEEDQERRIKYYNHVSQVLNLSVPGLDKGKGLYFMFGRLETRTPGGMRSQSVMTSYYKSQHFKTRFYDSEKAFTTPYDAIHCPDSSQSLYVQLLAGLLDRHAVLRSGAVFASSFLHAIHFLQKHWYEFERDVATGTLGTFVTHPSLRDTMSKILKPNANLARFLRKEFEAGDWDGIIRRIWPNMKVLDNVITGSMSQYVPLLEFYSGGIPLASMTYGCSETFVGINLNPLSNPSDISYTVMPYMAYFEFLPVHDPRSEPVDLADVEIGKEYEILVTTYSGLNRYRVGDVLRVVGFVNSAPQFRYVRRKNMLLSVDGDKTDETELQNAVERASRLLEPFGTCVAEYTSCTDVSSLPGHYVVYWELRVEIPEKYPTRDALNRCCNEMEESLSQVYRFYRSVEKSVGPLEIRVVENGTFKEMMDHAVSRGASINQYKVPRCVSHPALKELLDSRVVSAHFSTDLPRGTRDAPLLFNSR